MPAQPAGPATLNLMLSDGQRLNQTVMLEPWPVAETADTLSRLAAARRIARARISAEGQEGVRAFLDKRKARWAE